SDRGGLFVQVEGVAGCRRGQDVPRFLLKAVKRVELPRVVHVPAHAVKTREKLPAVAYLPCRYAGPQREVPDAAGTRARGIGLRLEWFVRDPEIGRPRARDHLWDHNVRGQRQVAVVELFGHDRADAGMHVLIGIGTGVVARETNLIAR